MVDGVFGFDAAMDGGGKILLVWDEGQVAHETYTGQSVWAKHFDPGSGWGPTQAIYDHGYTGQGVGGLGPQVAVLPSGDAVLVWQFKGSVWADEFEATSGWSTPYTLGDSISSNSLRIAVDGADAGFIAFKKDGCFPPCPPGPVTYATYASRWRWKKGFSSPQLVIQSRLSSGDPALLATDAAGNAFVAREASSFPNYPQAAIAIARFESNRGWLPPVVLPVVNQGGVIAPNSWLLALAADPTGDALALWTAEENWPGGSTLWVSSFHPSTGWDSPRRIDSSNLSVWNYAAAAAWTPDGGAAAFWYQNSPSGLWTSHMDSSGAWGAPQSLSKIVSLCPPAVAPDGSGGIVAAWQATLGTTGSLWAAQFSPAHGWGLPAPVASARDVGCPLLAATSQGHPFLFWSQTNEPASPVSGENGFQLYMSSLEGH